MRFPDGRQETSINIHYAAFYHLQKSVFCMVPSPENLMFLGNEL
jgi:hypothetical protein